MLPTIPSLRQPEYQISKSLRFRSSASAYLSRTFASGLLETTGTFSAWIKRGRLGVVQNIFTTGNTGQNFSTLYFTSGDQIEFARYAAGYQCQLTSTQVFRDTSAWYHIVVAWDSTQATASNRVKMYVNGVQITAFATATYPTQNLDMYFLNGDGVTPHQIGYYPTTGNYFDGYLAEVNAVKSQALTPAAFGATSSKTGVWAPKKYLGTYGTNGFYLDFADNSAATSATIGKDRSGNYNSWTPTNISMVAGATFDSMTDTPTQVGDVSYYYSGTQYPYNALQFRSSASTYLSRTPASAGNRKTWTWSGWVKRGALGAAFGLFGGQADNNHTANINFENTNKLYVEFTSSSSAAGIRRATNVFTDLSVWSHIVVAVDTTLSSNRIKIFINGVEATYDLSTEPSPSYDTWINATNIHYVGRVSFSSWHFNGYMADVNFIDGQALTPASFGETNSTGTWVPKTYTGAYGTNGFNLKFNDNSAATAAALGRDSAGTNNWTPTNLATTDVTSTEITSRSLVNPSYGLQFRSSASAYLSRTPTTSNRKTYTYSAWVKRGSLSQQFLFDAGEVVTPYTTRLYFLANNTLQFSFTNASLSIVRATTQVFSDVSTWYHIVCVVDTTQPTPVDRAKLYVNGQQITSFSTNTTTIAQNADTAINFASYVFYMGRNLHAPAGEYFDGVLADVNFIDGQALTPASFGETNSTGTWVPKTYSGTYGTNGFYLNFANRSAMTPAAIGDDASINNNQWTPNNMAIADAVDYGAKSVRGNYATLNPLIQRWMLANTSLSNGALQATNTTNIGGGHALGTLLIPSGKFYFEASIVATGYLPDWYIGVGSGTEQSEVYADTVLYYAGSGGALRAGSSVATWETFGVNDVIGIALDKTSNQVSFYKNNTLQGTVSLPTNVPMTLLLGTGRNSGSGWANFGQRPFAYTPPAGFKALCTQNLPEPAIVHGHAYMAATTYTGTGVGRNISNFSNNRSFRPDLVWIKSRSNATDHALYDTLRGAQQDLVSNSTATETTQSTGLTAFREDGFGLSTLTKLNSAGNTYVAWQWKAGDSVVTNTAGSITSQVDAGTTQGLSIVTYTGTGANATVGHGLGVAPKMIITKDRDTVVNWVVYHESMGGTSFARLNTTDAKVTDATIYNGTPSSTVFNIGSGSGINGSGKRMISYCFAEIAGYSKFGSYTGNGSASGSFRDCDGPFIYCNFKPKFVMIKQFTGTPSSQSNCSWMMIDTSRSDTNVVKTVFQAETNNTETYNTYPFALDIISNGFKIRSQPADAWNNISCSYIFAAFAEVPSKYALAR